MNNKIGTNDYIWELCKIWLRSVHSSFSRNIISISWLLYLSFPPFPFFCHRLQQKNDWLFTQKNCIVYKKNSASVTLWLQLCNLIVHNCQHHYFATSLPVLFSWRRTKTRTKKISNSFTRTRTITKDVQKNEKWIKTKKKLKPNWIKTRTKIQSRTKMKFWKCS